MGCLQTVTAQRNKSDNGNANHFKIYKNIRKNASETRHLPFSLMFSAIWSSSLSKPFQAAQWKRKYSCFSTSFSLLYNQVGHGYQLNDMPLWGRGYHLNDTLPSIISPGCRTHGGWWVWPLLTDSFQFTFTLTNIKALYCSRRRHRCYDSLCVRLKSETNEEAAELMGLLIRDGWFESCSLLPLCCSFFLT